MNIQDHAGHKLNLMHIEWYDSATVSFIDHYGIECDMYEGCGTMILGTVFEGVTREEAVGIMDSLQ